MDAAPIIPHARILLVCCPSTQPRQKFAICVSRTLSRYLVGIRNGPYRFLLKKTNIGNRGSYVLKTEYRLRSGELARAKAGGTEKTHVYKARREGEIQVANKVCFSVWFVLAPHLRIIRWRRDSINGEIFNTHKPLRRGLIGVPPPKTPENKGLNCWSTIFYWIFSLIICAP